MLNAAKPGHSADAVSAVPKKGKTLLGIKHPIVSCSNRDTSPRDLSIMTLPTTNGAISSAFAFYMYSVHMLIRKLHMFMSIHT